MCIRDSPLSLTIVTDYLLSLAMVTKQLKKQLESARTTATYDLIEERFCQDHSLRQPIAYYFATTIVILIKMAHGPTVRQLFTSQMPAVKLLLRQ